MYKQLLSVVSALVLASSPAVAATVFSDNFDGYVAPQLAWNGGGTWTTSTVDLVNSGSYGLTCAGGSGNCLDLSGNKPGSISKDLNLGAGTYQLSFDYTGNQLAPFITGDFSVGVGTLATTFTGLSSSGSIFTTYTGLFTLAAPGTVTLAFTQLPGGDTHRGVIIDNISVSSAVPEAGTWAMMLVGLGATGMVMRRRRNVRVSFA